MCAYTAKNFECTDATIQFFASSSCQSDHMTTKLYSPQTCSTVGSGPLADGALLVTTATAPGCTPPADTLPQGNVTLTAEEILCCMP
jgi:hypothetical protein